VIFEIGNSERNSCRSRHTGRHLPDHFTCQKIGTKTALSKNGDASSYSTRSCVELWTNRFLCRSRDSFVLQITLSFSGRSKSGWSHSIIKVLQKMQQMKNVLCRNFNMAKKPFLGIGISDRNRCVTSHLHR